MNVLAVYRYYLSLRVCVHEYVYLYGEQECPFPIQHVCSRGGASVQAFSSLSPMPLSPSCPYIPPPFSLPLLPGGLSSLPLSKGLL